MSATVEICESNDVAETITHNITNSNMGSVDEANLDPVANPIVNGGRSYAKYQRLHVTNMGGSSVIKELRVWRTGALGGASTHKTNARETGYTGPQSYVAPTSSAIANVDQEMPVAMPSGPNLGIAGALAGELIDVGYSDYLVHQLVWGAGDLAGATTSMNFQYKEVA